MKKALISLGFVVMLCSALLFAEVMWENDLALRTSVAIDWTSCSAPTPDGGVLFVWSDVHTENRKIYVQKINQLGNAVWVTPLAISTSEHSQYNPVILQTSDANFIILFIDTRLSSEGDLYAQKITPNGQLLWPAEGVPVCTAVSNQTNVMAVKDNLGGAFITWGDSRVAEDDYMYAQHLSSAGNRLWQAEGIRLAGNARFQATSLIQDGGDGIIVSYEDTFDTNRSVNIQRFGADGVPVWTTPLVIGDDTTDEREDSCKLYLLNNNEFIAIWQYSINWGPADLNIQRYNTNGQAVWVNPACIGADSEASYFMSKSALGNDGIFIAFNKDVAYLNHLSIRKVSYDGQLLWTDQATECDTIGVYSSINTSNIVPDNNGGCYLSWAKRLQFLGTDFDVRAQHFSAAGLKTWGTDGILLCNNDQVQELPALELSANRLFLGWSDYRLGSESIYYQMLSTDGVALLEADGRQLIYGLNGLQTGERFTLARNDDVVVIWDDDRDGWSGLYMQGINPDGSVDYAENGLQIVPGSGTNQYVQAAIVTPSGDVVVIWGEAVDTNWTLRLQKVAPDGSMPWGPNGIEVARTATCFIQYSFLSYDEGDIYIAWDAVYGGAANNLDRVWGQRVSNGLPQWGETGIMIRQWDETDLTHTFRLFGLAGRCYAWTEYQDPDIRDVVKVKLINPDGTPAPGWNAEGNPIYVEPTGITSSVSGRILTKKGDDWLVVWNFHETGLIHSAVAQLVSNSGTLIWGPYPFTLAEGLSLGSSYKVITEDDYFIVLLNSASRTDYSLYAKSFSADGNLLWAIDNLGQTSGYYCSFNIVRMENGSYAVIWDALAVPTGTDTQIMYNYISAEGDVFNPDNGYLLTESNQHYSNPQICVLGNEAYISWAEGRYAGGEYDEIYAVKAQKINTPYVDTQDDNTPQAAQVSGFTSYPNPFRGFTSIAMNLKQETDIKVSVYNIRGQKVRILHTGLLAKGEHQMLWDTKDNHGKAVASGVYFCRIEAAGCVVSRKLLLVK